MSAHEVIYQLRREVEQKSLLIRSLEKQNKELARQLNEASLRLDKCLNKKS